MSQIQVMLTSIEEVKNFVSLTNKYAFPIQMTTEKYKIDAEVPSWEYSAWICRSRSTS